MALELWLCVVRFIHRGRWEVEPLKIYAGLGVKINNKAGPYVHCLVWRLGHPVYSWDRGWRWRNWAWFWLILTSQVQMQLFPVSATLWQTLMLLLFGAGEQNQTSSTGSLHSPLSFMTSSHTTNFSSSWDFSGHWHQEAQPLFSFRDWLSLILGWVFSVHVAWAFSRQQVLSTAS